MNLKKLIMLPVYLLNVASQTAEPSLRYLVARARCRRWVGTTSDERQALNSVLARRVNVAMAIASTKRPALRACLQGNVQPISGTEMAVLWLWLHAIAGLKPSEALIMHAREGLRAMAAMYPQPTSTGSQEAFEFLRRACPDIESDRKFNFFLEVDRAQAAARG